MKNHDSLGQRSVAHVPKTCAKENISHGGTFCIWIDVTKYFEIQNFEIGRLQDFEKKTLFMYAGEKTILEWPKLVFEAIFPSNCGYI